jgi:hypothetical protein
LDETRQDGGDGPLDALRHEVVELVTILKTLVQMPGDASACLLPVNMVNINALLTTALPSADPTPTIAYKDAGGAKIGSKPNLAADGTADGSVTIASGKSAAENIGTEAADPFLLDAPVFSLLRIVPPSNYPAPAESTSPAPTPTAAVQTKASVAPFHAQQRETSSVAASVTVPVTPKLSAAAANGSTTMTARDQTASVTKGVGAARTKAAYGVEAASLSGSKGVALGPPAKRLPPGEVTNSAAGTASAPFSILLCAAF